VYDVIKMALRPGIGILSCLLPPVTLSKEEEEEKKKKRRRMGLQ
jgi:hypothetical protein